MSVIIHLVRHSPHADIGARLTGRADGRPLTDEGLLQARRLAARFERASVRMVQTSPRLRARQTAAAIAERVGASVEVQDALDEIDFGMWTGRPFAELEGDPLWERWNSERTAVRPPQGESMTEATARAVGCLQRLGASCDGGHIVCVTHCDIIRGAIAHYLGLSLDHLLRFDIDPGSVTSLSIGGWGGRVLMVNGPAPNGTHRICSAETGDPTDLTAKEPA